MSKKQTQEIQTLTHQLSHQKSNAETWQKAYTQQWEARQADHKSFADRERSLRNDHATQTRKIVEAGISAIEMAKLEGERDGALMALKLVLANKH